MVRLLELSAGVQSFGRVEVAHEIRDLGTSRPRGTQSVGSFATTGTSLRPGDVLLNLSRHNNRI